MPEVLESDVGEACPRGVVDVEVCLEGIDRARQAGYDRLWRRAALRDRRGRAEHEFDTPGHEEHDAERLNLVQRFIVGALDTMCYVCAPAHREEVVTHYMRRWRFDGELAKEPYKIHALRLRADGKVPEQTRRDEIELTRRAAGMIADAPITQAWDFRPLGQVPSEERTEPPATPSAPRSGTAEGPSGGYQGGFLDG